MRKRRRNNECNLFLKPNSRALIMNNSSYGKPEVYAAQEEV